ncbi:hypothetical protein ACWIEX_19840 [Bosea sp. NPDC055353]
MPSTCSYRPGLNLAMPPCPSINDTLRMHEVSIQLAGLKRTLIALYARNVSVQAAMQLKEALAISSDHTGVRSVSGGEPWMVNWLNARIDWDRVNERLLQQRAWNATIKFNRMRREVIGPLIDDYRAPTVTVEAGIVTVEWLDKEWDEEFAEFIAREVLDAVIPEWAKENPAQL